MPAAPPRDLERLLQRAPELAVALHDPVLEHFRVTRPRWRLRVDRAVRLLVHAAAGAALVLLAPVLGWMAPLLVLVAFMLFWVDWGLVRGEASRWLVFLRRWRVDRAMALGEALEAREPRQLLDWQLLPLDAARAAHLLSLEPTIRPELPYAYFFRYWFFLSLLLAALVSMGAPRMPSAFAVAAGVAGHTLLFVAVMHPIRSLLMLFTGTLLLRRRLLPWGPIAPPVLPLSSLFVIPLLLLPFVTLSLLGASMLGAGFTQPEAFGVYGGIALVFVFLLRALRGPLEQIALAFHQQARDRFVESWRGIGE